VCDLFYSFISGKIEGASIDNRELSDVLRLTTQDLKTCLGQLWMFNNLAPSDVAALTRKAQRKNHPLNSGGY
jgi:hypothetical protein